MQKYEGRVLDSRGRPVTGVQVEVRKYVGGTVESGEPGAAGSLSGPGAGGSNPDFPATNGAKGGAWGQPGGSTTSPGGTAQGGAGGHAVKLTNGATVTWLAGNTSARRKGPVGA